MTYVLYVGRKKVGEGKSLKTARAKAYDYIQEHPPMVVYIIDKGNGSGKDVTVGNVQVKGGEVLFDSGKGKYAVNGDGSLSVAKGKPSKDAPKVFKTTKIAKRAQEDTYDWRKDSTTYSNIMPPDKSKGRWVIVLFNDKMLRDTGNGIEGIVQRDGETTVPYDSKNPVKSLGGALRYEDKERKAMSKALRSLNGGLSGDARNYKLYAVRMIKETKGKDGKKRIEFVQSTGQKIKDVGGTILGLGLEIGLSAL